MGHFALEWLDHYVPEPGGQFFSKWVDPVVRIWNVQLHLYLKQPIFENNNCAILHKLRISRFHVAHILTLKGLVIGILIFGLVTLMACIKSDVIAIDDQPIAFRQGRRFAKGKLVEEGNAELDKNRGLRKMVL